ncbi:MAG: single-stranded DNA-binding protein [Kineosporiaceae bacterium]
MKENHVSLSGFVATDPQSRTVNGESLLASFRLGSTPRHLDRRTGVWVDGRTTWVTVKCWRQLARNVMTSLAKGSRVVVTGKLVSSQWTTPEGQPRSRVEVDADSIAVDLTFGTVDFHKVSWSEPNQIVDRPEEHELSDQVEHDSFPAEFAGVDGAFGGGHHLDEAADDELDDDLDDDLEGLEDREPVGV